MKLYDWRKKKIYKRKKQAERSVWNLNLCVDGKFWVKEKNFENFCSKAKRKFQRGLV